MNLLKSLCIVLALAALAPSYLVHAQDALVGSWVLDPAKNQGSPGAVPTAGTATVTAAGGGRYTSASEVSVGGVTGRSEITYSVDGKDYAVTMTPAQPGAAITQSMERISDTVWRSNLKLNGQLMATVMTEVSRDGKTLTQTTTGLGQFAALSSTVVFQRK
ncbi:MAG TPA: hypothetical protein VGL98_17250 [Gammaproteobacteria bacterium]